MCTSGTAVANLHPAMLNDLGLVPSLTALVDQFREREGMFATYLGTDVPEAIDPITATTLYRVTQEALRNVAKHAGRTHVKVLLGRDTFSTGRDSRVAAK